MGADVGKRLDHFLLKESLLDCSTCYKSWVLQNNISDHFPIALQLDVNPRDSFRPFKFDRSWLKNDDLCQMIKIFWENYCILAVTNVMDHFIIKLKALKKELFRWT